MLRTKSAAELVRLNKTDFWIQLESRYRPINITSYAMLSYTEGKYVQPENVLSTPPPPIQAPLALTWDIQNWLEYRLQPLMPNEFPTASEVSRTVVLRSSQVSSKAGVEWTVNNNAWTENDEHLGDTPLITHRLMSELHISLRYIRRDRRLSQTLMLRSEIMRAGIRREMSLLPRWAR